MFIIQVWILCFRITFLSRCLLAATRRLLAATRRLVTYPQQRVHGERTTTRLRDLFSFVVVGRTEGSSRVS